MEKKWHKEWDRPFNISLTLCPFPLKEKVLLNSEGTEQCQVCKLFEKSYPSGQEYLRFLSGERWLTVRVQQLGWVLLGQQWQSWKTPYHSNIRRGKSKQTGWPKSNAFSLHPQVMKQTSYKTSDSPRSVRSQCLTWEELFGYLLPWGF